MNENERINLLKEKVQDLFDNQTSAHVVLANKRFYNGLIKKLASDYFVVFDFKLKYDMKIFYKELLLVEPYKPKKEAEDE